MSLRWLLPLLAGLLIFPAGSRGASEPSPEQLQAVLAPYADMMERLPAALTQPMRTRAVSWLELSGEEQEHLRENLADWDERSPRQRLRLRERHQAWRLLDAEARTEVLQARARFESLSEEEQQRLRARFEALPETAQQAFLQDRRTRQILASSRAWFRFVPPEEQVQMLDFLRALDARQLETLNRQFLRRTPTQREALRQALMEPDSAARMEILEAG